MDIKIREKNTEPAVLFAGEELKRYLERMLANEEGSFTVTLDLKTDSEDKTDSYPDTRRDSFAICMDRFGGAITGINPRSVLLGVYDYLRYLGCRFLSYVKKTEIVPNVSVEKLAVMYKKQASFLHRGVCIEGADSMENVLDFIDWLPKAGYNSFFLQFKVPYVFLARWYHHDNNPYAEPDSFFMEDAERCTKSFEEAMKKRDLILHKAGHGWTGDVLGCQVAGSWEINQEPLAENKRLLAAKVSGKRDYFRGVPTDTNLCMSNPDAVDRFAELTVQYSKENPAVDCLHIWLADGYNNVCECEECQKTTLSDQYVTLLNEIDRRLTEEKLDTRIVFLLYQELLWPPIREKLRNPERFILMFAPISRTFETSYNLDGKPAQITPYVRNHIALPTELKKNLAFLAGWQEQFKGEGFVYDYPLGRAHYGDFGYLHISRIISQDIKKLQRMGLHGYISCQELRAAMPNMLPNYVMGYTLFDENADVEALIREYYEAAYPEEPEAAQQYLEKLSALSSCDYINGKGERVDADIAGRMEQIINVCLKQEKELDKRGSGLFWTNLRYHNGYVLRLAKALKALACGSWEESQENYQEMHRYICAGEPVFQPFLDVYRILDVTQNYTGFGRR